tara:strand:+ start:2659 stop:2889 length:231 start_codon:yes stop_codon:yes gene_type:complete
MAEAKTNIISIDGTDYNPDDLSQEQKYQVNQIQDLMTKANQLRFQLDQITAAQNVFTNGLIESLKPKEDSENKEAV